MSLSIEDFKGTKGEWFALLEYGGVYSIQNEDYYGGRNILEKQSVIDTEVEANALLITKATELLEILINLHQAVSSGNPHLLSEWNLKAKILTHEILKQTP